MTKRLWLGMTKRLWLGMTKHSWLGMTGVNGWHVNSQKMSFTANWICRGAKAALGLVKSVGNS
jgi:hypothetical protein